MRRSDRILGLGGGLFLAAWFLALAGQGLEAWFSGDDLMNLYGAWNAPVWRIFRGILLTAPEVFRPAGALWYRAIFAVAGFDPLPFHACAFAILFLNLFLTYALARRLSGRRETAALAALFVSYNARFVNLYFDTGAIYDVLCYGFYCGALLWYARLREQGRYPDARQLAVLCVLAVFALNSKEMAVTLPAMLLGFELAYHPPKWRILGEWRRWTLDNGRAALVTGAIAMVFAVGKAAGPGALVNAPGYRVDWSAGHLLAVAGGYLDHLFYRYGWFGTGRTLGLWAAMLLVAAASRNRTLRFAWLYLTVTLAPMLVVDLRAGSAMYICLFGWGLYAGELLVRLTDPLRVVPARAKGALLFVAVAAVLWPHHRFEGGFTTQSALQSGAELRPLWTSLHQARPRFRPGARILFLSDPLRVDVFDLMYLVRLSYGDNTLTVDRVKMMPVGQAPDWSRYDSVFDYIGGRLVELQRR